MAGVHPDKVKTAALDHASLYENLRVHKRGVSKT
jgi:hypothetical protein